MGNASSQVCDDTCQQNIADKVISKINLQGE